MSEYIANIQLIIKKKKKKKRRKKNKFNLCAP
jgi:hypothetical protein